MTKHNKGLTYWLKDKFTASNLSIEDKADAAILIVRNNLNQVRERFNLESKEAV